MKAASTKRAGWLKALENEAVGPASPSAGPMFPNMEKIAPMDVSSSPPSIVKVMTPTQMSST